MAITPDITVEEVVKRYPATREVLARLGVNHCCGAHLRLDQAAAAAGVPMATLLLALETAAKVPA
jgi:iron-sulfur cluster repair protein YtfE (RIC family)